MARALMAWFALWSGALLAQPLPDPTRPPSGVAGGGAGDGTLAGAAAPSALQSVILRPGAKPRALLGNEWVELGQTYNGARVIKITENSVTLKGPTGRETMQLTPEAEKKMVKKSGGRGSDTRGIK